MEISYENTWTLGIDDIHRNNNRNGIDEKVNDKDEWGPPQEKMSNNNDVNEINMGAENLTHLLVKNIQTPKLGLVRDINIKYRKRANCNYTTSREIDTNPNTRAIHDKVKKIKCMECDYAASRNYTLKLHKRSVHDRVKNFKCTECDHAASENGTLKVHHRAEHYRLCSLR